jgi:hypothetical protein
MDCETQRAHDAHGQRRRYGRLYFRGTYNRSRYFTEESSEGSVASFGTEQEFAEKTSFSGTLGGHFEEFVDEPILTPDATPAQPPYLSLPNYVHRLTALNRSSRSVEFAKPFVRHWKFRDVPAPQMIYAVSVGC